MLSLCLELNPLITIIGIIFIINIILINFIIMIINIILIILLEVSWCALLRLNCGCCHPSDHWKFGQSIIYSCAVCTRMKISAKAPTVAHMQYAAMQCFWSSGEVLFFRIFIVFVLLLCCICTVSMLYFVCIFVVCVLYLFCIWTVFVLYLYVAEKMLWKADSL